jgi:hypothetical protein
MLEGQALFFAQRAHANARRLPLEQKRTPSKLQTTTPPQHPQNQKTEGRVFDLGLNASSLDDGAGGPDDGGRRRDPAAIVRDFKAFIQTHFAHDRRAADEPLVYRQQLNKDPTQLTVDLVHVRLHDARLGAELEARPAEYLPLVRERAPERGGLG